MTSKDLVPLKLMRRCEIFNSLTSITIITSLIHFHDEDLEADKRKQLENRHKWRKWNQQSCY